jgi:hypothetical protein
MQKHKALRFLQFSVLWCLQTYFHHFSVRRFCSTWKRARTIRSNHWDRPLKNSFASQAGHVHLILESRTVPELLLQIVNSDSIKFWVLFSMPSEKHYFAFSNPQLCAIHDPREPLILAIDAQIYDHLSRYFRGTPTARQSRRSTRRESQ